MVGPQTELDTILSLCADRHRRIVLAVLAAEQRPLTVNDLRTAIITNNHEMAVSDASERLVEQIHVSLHHVHVPKLASAGLVEYDAERKLVSPTAQFDQWQPVIATITDADTELEGPVEL